MTKVLELYGASTRSGPDADWEAIVERERCPYLQKKCIKRRKSRPDITIGTCSMLYGKESKEIIICPFRLLERRQVFTDCLHLLTLHEPGNELHIIPEVSIPGGNVDYFLVSTRNNEIVHDAMAEPFQSLQKLGKLLSVQSVDTLLLLSNITFGLYAISQSETAEKAQHWIYKLPKTYRTRLEQERLIAESMQATATVFVQYV
ncbi:MAG: hypothetical protein ACYDER_13235 [Ktedonobacteraceae bacterium]